MKVLVGLMYSIESEYAVSQWSLRQQTYTDYEVFKIEDMANKEAHDAMYQTFMDHSDRFDLFMKLDADMVLCRADFLARAVHLLKENPSVDDLQIGVHDFFMDELIHGLHIYSNRVRWAQCEEQVFVDMIDQRKQRMQDMRILAPAAWHCPNPSLMQSFHYGVHRAIKVWQHGAVTPLPHMRKQAVEYISKLIGQWSKRKDARVGYATLGAFYGLKESVGYSFSDYKGHDFQAMYQKVQGYDLRALEEEIARVGQYAKAALLQL